MRVFSVVALLWALLSVMGCGGGVSNSGRATLTVRWPDRSRLIPFAAESIRVTISRGGQGLGTTLLTRPAGGGSASALIDRLSVGAATVTATAYPNADGTGVAQAAASVLVTVVAGQTVPVRLTMASTVARLSVAPSAPRLIVGETTTLIATPKNAAGETVLVSPATLSFATDAASVATIDGAGKVTAVGAGSANLTVTETESGIQATVVVSVGAGPSGNVAFGTPNVYALPGAGPVAVADMDGDGKADVIASGNQDVVIFYGHGDGTLDAASVAFHRVDGLLLADARDMNGDGKPDIVCSDGLSKLHVLINLGSRQFAAPKTVFVPNCGLFIVADFNNDGRPDTAGLRPGSGSGGSFVILLNQGDGAQALTGDSYGLPWIPDGIHPCDINGDGKIDIVGSYGANTIGRSGFTVFRGDGRGKFTEVSSMNWGTLNSPTPTSGDFDRDGKLDIVQSDYWGGNIVVYGGNGDGTLRSGVPYSAPPYPLTLRAMDVNRDGWTDLFTANAGSTHASILLNQGGGVFADRIFFESGGNNIRFGTVADLTGDGKPELILSGESSGTVSVLVNQTP